MERPDLLVISPLFDSKRAGGMGTHIERLKALPCFAGASFAGVGGASDFRGRVSTLIQLCRLKMYRSAGGNGTILINSSFYFPSLLKMLWMLSLFRFFAPGSSIFVFFHGGRIDASRLSCRTLRSFWRCFSRAEYFFLTEEQLGQFAALFPRLPLQSMRQFRNYGASERAEMAAEATGARRSAPFKLLCVGRMTPEKGQSVACDAIQDLVDVTLTLVGGGPDEARIRQRYADQIANGKIVIRGFLQGSALVDEFRAADLVLIPTVWPEGLPYVLIESYEHGVPVAATDVGAMGPYIRRVDGNLLLSQATSGEIVRVVAHAAGSNGRWSEKREAAAHVYDECFSASAANRFYSSLIETAKNRVLTSGSTA